jgi:hypothetical protein
MKGWRQGSCGRLPALAIASMKLLISNPSTTKKKKKKKKAYGFKK